MRAQIMLLAMMTLGSTQVFADADFGVSTCKAGNLEIKMATTMRGKTDFGIADLITKVNGRVVESKVTAEAVMNNRRNKLGQSYPGMYAVVIGKGKASFLVNVNFGNKTMSDVNHDDKIGVEVFGRRRAGKKYAAAEQLKGLCHFEKNNMEAFNAITGNSTEGTEQANAEKMIEFTKCRDVEVSLSTIDQDKGEYEINVNAYSKLGEQMLGAQTLSALVDKSSPQVCGYCNASKYVRHGQDPRDEKSAVLFESFENARYEELNYDKVILNGRNFNLQTCKFE